LAMVFLGGVYTAHGAFYRAVRNLVAQRGAGPARRWGGRGCGGRHRDGRRASLNVSHQTGERMKAVLSRLTVFTFLVAGVASAEQWQGMSEAEIRNGIRGALTQHNSKFSMLCSNQAYLKCLAISQAQCLTEIARYHGSCLSTATTKAFTNLDYYVLTRGGAMQLGSDYAQCHIDSHVGSKDNPESKRSCIAVLSLF
jgi:hypothetical protein